MLIHKAKSLTFLVTPFSLSLTKEQIKEPNNGNSMITDNIGKEVKIKSQNLKNKILTKTMIPVNITTA